MVWTQRGVCPQVCGQVLSAGILEVTGMIAASCGPLSGRQSLYVTSRPHSHPQLMDAAWLWGQEDRNRQAWNLRQAHRQAGQSSRALSVNYGTRAHGAGTNHEAVRHRKRHCLPSSPSRIDGLRAESEFKMIGLDDVSFPQNAPGEELVTQDRARVYLPLYAM